MAPDTTESSQLNQKAHLQRFTVSGMRSVQLGQGRIGEGVRDTFGMHGNN